MMQGAIGAVLAVLFSAPSAVAWQGLYSFPETAGAISADQPADIRGADAFTPSEPLPGLENGIPSLSGLSEDDFGGGAPHASSTPRIVSGRDQGPPEGACIAAIQAAEKRYGLPEDLLLAIGIQEAGTQREGKLTIWPWVVNSDGKGYRFESQQDAVAFVHREHAAGRVSTDLGCLQINTRWHPSAFATVSDGFDPELNADYAARYLSTLYAEAGDWLTAAGNYHSRTAIHHDRYRAGILKNLQVAAVRKSELLDLTGTSQNPEFAKNGVEGDEGFSLNRNLRNEALRPGAYRRQVARIKKAEAASHSNVRRMTTLPDPVSEVAAENSGAWWSAEMTASETGGSSRSIYSRKDLEPVLPELITGRQ